MDMRIDVINEYEELPYNKHDEHILIKLVSSSQDVSTNQPLYVCLIIDVSGSMQLWMPIIKKACAGCFEKLREIDRVCVLTCSNSVKVIQTWVPCTKSLISKLKDKVNLLEASGGSNLSAGVFKGFETIINLAPCTESSVILISDGNPNQGIVGDTCLPKMARRIMPEMSKLHTLGVGEKNSVFLLALAQTCKGEYVDITEDTDSLASGITRVLGAGKVPAYQNVVLELLSPDIHFFDESDNPFVEMFVGDITSRDHVTRCVTCHFVKYKEEYRIHYNVTAVDTIEGSNTGINDMFSIRRGTANELNEAVRAHVECIQSNALGSSYSLFGSKEIINRPIDSRRETELCVSINRV
jgi:Mg-chelatase subunit ChlD